MKEITRINHVRLKIRDLAVSQTFYKKLGFIIIVGPIDSESVPIMKHPSGVYINFILNTPKDAPPINKLMKEAEKHTGYTHIILEITDSESVVKQLQSQEITISETVEFEGAKFFFIKDPDGNVIEFHKPAS